MHRSLKQDPAIQRTVGLDAGVEAQPCLSSLAAQAPAGGWLPSLICAIGGDRFLPALLNALQFVFGVDHLVVFTFSRHGGTGTMATGGRIKPRLADRLAHEYAQADWFRADPNLPLIRSGEEAVRLVSSIMLSGRYSREYRQRFFESAQIVDKIAMSVRAGEDLWLYINCYRLADHGPFGEAERDELLRHGEVLAAVLMRHRQLSLGTRLLDTAGTIFDAVTPRERQVCSCIISGLTLGGTAASLGVSLKTVLTLRRRAYARLGIATERELVRLALRRE